MNMICLNFHNFIPNTLQKVEFSFKKSLSLNFNSFQTNAAGIVNVKTYMERKIQ